jgi:hypothetical protein
MSPTTTMTTTVMMTTMGHVTHVVEDNNNHTACVVDDDAGPVTHGSEIIYLLLRFMYLGMNPGRASASLDKYIYYYE